MIVNKEDDIMQTRLNEIHEYLLTTGCTNEELANFDSHSVYLAMEIMLYAHRNQKRVNGEEYTVHPLGCLELYRRMVGIIPDDYFCIDVDLMAECRIPYEGVQELCLLHDVLEDSDFTFSEVREIFVERGLGNYFDLYISVPLKNITHNKSDEYEKYISTCMQHPTSALVKMIDMQDNLNILTLSEFNQTNYQRACKYLSFMYLINSKHHFIENNKKYLSDFLKDKGTT